MELISFEKSGWYWRHGIFGHIFHGGVVPVFSAKKVRLVSANLYKLAVSFLSQLAELKWTPSFVSWCPESVEVKSLKGFYLGFL